ncbi:dynamin family protein [Zalerion maritima]|uniref:Dynamin family protein n=1 Tax=Zalerion maritima TaxID=339359 RepID=A0AAD5WU25_9PEZI|nr:dynamin family protein [Zalerion maritima]
MLGTMPASIVVKSEQGSSSGPTMLPPVSVPGAPSLTTTAIRKQQRRSAAPTAVSHGTENDTPLLMQVRSLENSMVSMPASQTQSSEGDDLAFMPFKNIGVAVKACNDTLAQLQQLGVSHVVSLPELVLVGDQSSGKSSLMSSIGDLSLPRSEGVCTRCPIHIRLSSNREWAAKISLHLDYSFPDTPRANGGARLKVTANDKFPPWVPQARETIEFKVLDKDHKGEIENTLRWAQVALLSPGISPEQFVPGVGHIAAESTLAEQMSMAKAKFSPNIIALEIKGPGLPDLSFFDLPGLIKSTANEEDTYLVKVVENLAKKYISHEKAIILWAVPMTLDPDNSSTFQVIREMKATNRTVGVMTKADLLQPGDHGQWIRMLRGDPNAFRVGHGYYATARPQQLDPDDATKWEEAFFNGTLDGHTYVPNYPWPYEFQHFNQRTGVSHLRKFLSEKLGEEFARSLPSIKRKILEQRDQVTTSLAALPELPKNVEYEVRRSLSQFVGHVKKDIEDDSFSSNWRQLSMAFQNCIVGMKPRFTVTDHSDQRKIIEIGDSDDEGSNGTVPATPTPNRKRAAEADAIQSVSQRRRLQGATPIPRHPYSPAGVLVKREPANGTPASVASSLPAPQNPGPGAFTDIFALYSGSGKNFMTIRQIRNQIQAMGAAGMPDVVDRKVYNSISMRAVSKWEHPIIALVNATMSLLRSVFENALGRALASLQRRLVYKESMHHIHRFLDNRRREIQELLTRMYRYESTRLFTINEETLYRYRTSEGELLREARHYYRWKAYNGGKQAVPFKPLAQMTEEERAKEVKEREKQARVLSPDTWGQELGVAAYVRGYYLTAAHRFSELAAMSINNGTFQEIPESLDCYLDKELGLIGNTGMFHSSPIPPRLDFRVSQSANHSADPNRFHDLMEEDEETGRKRHQYKNLNIKLNQAMDSITELEKNYARESVVTVDNRLFAHSDVDAASHSELDGFDCGAV